VLAARDELLATGLSQGYERVLLDLAGYKTGGPLFANLHSSQNQCRLTNILQRKAPKATELC